jgi:hypothetical protein
MCTDRVVRSPIGRRLDESGSITGHLFFSGRGDVSVKDG